MDDELVHIRRRGLLADKIADKMLLRTNITGNCRDFERFLQLYYSTRTALEQSELLPDPALRNDTVRRESARRITDRPTSALPRCTRIGETPQLRRRSDPAGL
ncbi:hypothetical protein CERZMDRAFT_103564 [Cercospora zeae-maydis SCOH1-5]|uniref:Uncharacterized protein n=1 Tax=Cercospora zeae-maydis SCOH1-5 TaxID=717836 RepID=A0A6A6EX14_9PEZI|nr:hypothetical protein CERZMDRAFT_103564 [Cercospora zeae-maydis SCOH1-5]